MGCGKSKHDVVTGNTRKIKKPSEVESVKGKQSETITRQESCRCRKKNDVSSDVVSSDQPEITVETNTKKPEEKNDVGEYDEKTAVEITNGDKKPEEKETMTTSLPVEAVAAIVPENIVTEETVNDVNESVSPVVDEQKEKTDIVTVVEEEKSVEDNIDHGDVDTDVPSTEVEEPKPDVETPVTTEVEAQEIATTENDETPAAENDETAAAEHEETVATENDESSAAENVETVETENDETPVTNDEDKGDVEEEKPADITKEVESV